MLRLGHRYERWCGKQLICEKLQYNQSRLGAVLYFLATGVLEWQPQTIARRPQTMLINLVCC